MDERGENANRLRRAFFVPHPLNPNGTPGRMPFRVEADLIANGATPTRDTVIVCADGYGNRHLTPTTQGVVGPNQDPCVFARPLPVIHSFCRINGGSRHALRSQNGTNLQLALSAVVEPDDIIIYGKYQPASRRKIEEDSLKSVWVDTVIVVERVVPWRTTLVPGGRYVLDNPHHFAPILLPGVPNPPATDVWQYNLEDALPGRGHQFTHLQNHRVIVGRACADEKALRTMQTSFVPLAQRCSRGWFPPTLHQPRNLSSRMGQHNSTWQDLADFIHSCAGNDNRASYLREFDNLSLALDLCEAVVRISGRDQMRAGCVAIPPLIPTPVPQRNGAGVVSGLDEWF